MERPSNCSIKKEDYADFRLNLALRRIGQKILLEILKFAIPKLPDQTFYDFAVEKKVWKSKNFDVSQKNKLKSDVTGESFDITLIFKLLVNCCQNIKPQGTANWKTTGEFEFHLGKIKKARNDVVHSSVPVPYELLEENMFELRQTFIKTLEAAQVRFQIEESVIRELKDLVEKDIVSIISSPLSQTDVDEFVATEGVFESKFKYKRLSNVNPVDFFVGVDFSSNIEDIFVTLEVKELDSHANGQKIDFHYLLKSFIKNKVSILVIEGLAGSGKTTLSKYVLSQWVNNGFAIHGLDKFTFVLYVQCNNPYINSIYDLISSVIPETSRRFNRDELVESVLCQSLLVIVDGIDEAHQGTKSVLQELFHKSYFRNIKFFCTSRPERVHWIYRVKGDLSCGTLSISGIAKENRNSFVKKLYNHYKNAIESKVLCPLNKILSILEKLSRTVIINDLKLPLFLALFTYLCAVQPSKMECLNSVVSLYSDLISALRHKLLNRTLSKNQLACTYDEDEVEDTITDCFNIFCEEALVSLINDEETLSKDSLLKIKKCSSKIGINAKDILSSFLVVKVILTPLGIEEVVGFPHKGLKEYLGAKAAAQKVKSGDSINEVLVLSKKPQSAPECGDQALSLETKLPQLDLNTGLMKYQNFLLYLSGILVNENMLTDTLTNEIIRLYKKSGAYLASQWLSLIVALNFHYLACEFLFMKFRKLKICEDYFDTFIKLLQYNCPKEVVIQVYSESSNNILQLQKIISKLNNYDCNVKIILRPYVRNPRSMADCDVLKILASKTSRCNVNWYEGTLNEYGMKSLPQSMNVLCLGIGTPEQAKALQFIGENSDIFYLKLHIERQVSPKDIPTVREVFDCFLFLSNVSNSLSDVLWVKEIVNKISSNKKYGKIFFPSSDLNPKTTYKILNHFQSLNIKIGVKSTESDKGHSRGGIFVHSKYIADEGEIKAFCNRILGCTFRLMSEEEIWSS